MKKTKGKKRDLLSIFDLTAEETLRLIQRAAQMKKDIRAGKLGDILRGKSVALIFEKASTRTRISFEVGVWQLGGQPLFISSRDTQMGRGEPIKDTARVLSRYVSMIMLRTFDQKTLEDLAANASVPVINGLSDLSHPCQVLSDLLTVAEHKIEGNWMVDSKILRKGLKKLSFAWIGDGNNMANSWIAASGVLGLKLALACPERFRPAEAYLKKSSSIGGRISLTTDPAGAAEGADVVGTDVWASMGQEKEAEERRRAFKGYCVDAALMKRAAREAVFMHCLPAHRGEEVSDDVMEGRSSIVWDQAENRLHMQKAIMEMLVHAV
jgi:ornithine carbamoyltransferase